MLDVRTGNAYAQHPDYAGCGTHAADRGESALRLTRPTDVIKHQIQSIYNDCC
jgi:hypothetical protein